MVSDARVSRQLARLGGVYRDPARVNRDASSLLLSSVGSHLTPIAALHVDDSGDSQTVLVLQGTIAIHFRGQTYQLLVDLYLVPAYPQRPPVCYVRLAPNMYLKQNHRHVEPDGKVYMPYLSEWNAGSHNLVEMTVALSSVFSADPPVFSRPPPPQPAGALGPPSASSYTTVPSHNVTSATTSSSSSMTASTATITTQGGSSSAWKVQQDQLEALMAQEAAEANAAAETARRAEQEEQRVLEQGQKLATYEEAQRVQVKAAVTAKIQTHCREQASQTLAVVRQDALDQQKLHQQMATASSLATQILWMKEKKVALEKSIVTTTECTKEIQSWLAQHDANSKNPTNQSPTNPKKSIDEICVGGAAVDTQMLDLAAENASISDALYFLDKALNNNKQQQQQQQQNNIGNGNTTTSTADTFLTDHLRQVRKLAQKQFMVRALLLKVGSVQRCRGD